VTEILLASSRDAMAWDRPNTRTRKQVHVAVNVQNIGHAPGYSDAYAGEAACDPSRTPLDMSVASPAEDIPLERRCRRPGCAARWPAYKPRISS
jgi:hypothetical protein